MKKWSSLTTIKAEIATSQGLAYENPTTRTTAIQDSPRSLAKKLYLVLHNMDNGIHSFDFSELRTSVLNDENREHLSQKLVTTLSAQGFVVLRNTGLNKTLILQAFFWVCKD